ITEELSYDVSWNTYTYPQNSSANVDEWIGKLSAYGLTVGAKDAYDPASALYTFGSYDYDVPYQTGLGLGTGPTDTKHAGTRSEEKDNGWYVSLSNNIATVDVALTYSDTDIGGDSCVNNFGYTAKDSCDTNLTVSVSKSF